MRAYQFFGQQLANVVIGEHLDRVELVRGPKTVEEMDERHAGDERRGVRHQREIVSLLHRRRGQQCEPGLAHRHHVGVVAEDRQPLRGHRASSDMDHRRSQLAGDLVHVGDHQQQALRGGEGRRQGTALQCAMQRSGRPGFALHLHHRRHRAPHIGLAAAGPLVCLLGHRRGRRDWIDAADLAAPVGDRYRRAVAVDGGTHQRGSGNISMACTGHCS